MTYSEKTGREYCLSIGADPDEMVWGYILTPQGRRERIESKRWCWYVGAKVG